MWIIIHNLHEGTEMNSLNKFVLWFHFCKNLKHSYLFSALVFLSPPAPCSSLSLSECLPPILSSFPFSHSVVPLYRATFLLHETLRFPSLHTPLCFESFRPVYVLSGLHWSTLRGSDAELRYCCPLGSVCPAVSCGDRHSSVTVARWWRRFQFFLSSELFLESAGWQVNFICKIDWRMYVYIA